ncbi:MAG: hypothetical protein IH897_11385 [Planctomycetes bacterium]|nr:hypothetical protein [Planctomycetota bacterium]
MIRWSPLIAPPATVLSWPDPMTGENNGSPASNHTFKIEIWLGVVDTENGLPTPKHIPQGGLGGGNIKVHN